jgi:exopolysaccharide biosynthesis polyprenyl glycosylphosphotransferase
VLYQNLHVFSRSLRLIDAVTLAACAVVPWWLDLPSGAWEGVTGGEVVMFAAALVISFAAVARRLSVYHTRRMQRLRRELLAMTETGVLALALATLVAELTLGGLPMPAYATVGVTGALVLLGVRFAVRIALRELRSIGRDYRAWLLVGRNPRSAAIARDILANPHYGIRILGVVDSPTKPPGVDPGREFSVPPLSDLPVVEFENPEGMRDLVEHQAIDEVIVTLPLRSFYDEVEHLVKLCAKGGVSVKLPARSFAATEGGTEVVHLGDAPFVTHFSGPADTFSLALKRLLDLAVSFLVLVLASPLLLLVAAAIRLNTPGPVFYRQTRVGLNGRLFTLLKFRTMVADADALKSGLGEQNEADGPVFKMRDDPRITSVGRLLRRYYLDELPQLLNVLMGEMSLVGPRPPVPEETERYEWWQRRRLSMPPGMTCIWQVADEHHGMPFEQWMELDLQYIDRWSLGLDLRLLVATASHVVRGQGW